MRDYLFVIFESLEDSMKTYSTNNHPENHTMKSSTSVSFFGMKMRFVGKASQVIRWFLLFIGVFFLCKMLFSKDNITLRIG